MAVNPLDDTFGFVNEQANILTSGEDVNVRSESQVLANRLTKKPTSPLDSSLPDNGANGYTADAAASALRAYREKQQTTAESSDTARGFKRSFREIEPMAIGVSALAAEAAGQEELSNSLLDKYQQASRSVQEDVGQRQTLQDVIEGDASLVDWMQDGIGYVAGQAAQVIATMGVGGVIGKGSLALAGKGAEAMVARKISQIVAEEAATRGLKGVIQKQTGKLVAAGLDNAIKKGTLAKVGEDAIYQAAAKEAAKQAGRLIGVSAYNFGMELGQIAPEAMMGADESGVDTPMGRVFVSALGAAAMESVADTIGMGKLAKAFKGDISKPLYEALIGGVREGVTEVTQSGIERWGASQSLTSQEALWDYLESGALGALGGTAGGGVTGAAGQIMKSRDEKANSPTPPDPVQETLSLPPADQPPGGPPAPGQTGRSGLEETRQMPPERRLEDRSQTMDVGPDGTVYSRQDALRRSQIPPNETIRVTPSGTAIPPAPPAGPTSGVTYDPANDPARVATAAAQAERDFPGTVQRGEGAMRAGRSLAQGPLADQFEQQDRQENDLSGMSPTQRRVFVTRHDALQKRLNEIAKQKQDLTAEISQFSEQARAGNKQARTRVNVLSKKMEALDVENEEVFNELTDIRDKFGMAPSDPTTPLLTAPDSIKAGYEATRPFVEQTDVQSTSSEQTTAPGQTQVTRNRLDEESAPPVDSKDWYYSALEREIQNSKQSKMPAKQWLAVLKNNQNVKQAELDETELEEFLSTQPEGESMDKQTLLDYMDNVGKVQLREVNYGESLNEAVDREALDNEFWAAQDQLVQINARLRHRLVFDANDGVSFDRIEPGDDTWYVVNANSQDTSPSLDSFAKAVNYAERRGWVKNVRAMTAAERDAVEKEKVDAEEWVTGIAQKRNNASDSPRWEGYTMGGDKQNYREMVLTLPEQPGMEFKGGEHHWPGVKNPLVHIRFNDRTDENGKKALFIEEMQSDWHQKGRERGYKLTGTALRKAEDAHQAAIAKHGMYSPEYEASLKRLSAARVGGVPAAPFSEGKDWSLLAFKRMMRYAAENGYDKIMWTPGAVQSDRNNQVLADRIDNITVEREAPDDHRKLALLFRKMGDIKQTLKEYRDYGVELASNPAPNNRAWNDAVRVTGDNEAHASEKLEYIKAQIRRNGGDPNGQLPPDPDRAEGLYRLTYTETGSSYPRTYHNEDTRSPVLTPEEVQRVVGKDLAKKLVDEANKNGTSTIDAAGIRLLSRDGSGMEYFYDTMVPSAVKKYVKKFGGTVAKSKLSDKPPQMRVVKSKSDFLEGDEPYDVWRVQVETSPGRWKDPGPIEFDSEQEAQKWIDEAQQNHLAMDVHGDFWSVDLTPKMAQAAMEGQPLFKKDAKASGAVSKQDYQVGSGKKYEPSVDGGVTTPPASVAETPVPVAKRMERLTSGVSQDNMGRILIEHNGSKIVLSETADPLEEGIAPLGQTLEDIANSFKQTFGFDPTDLITSVTQHHDLANAGEAGAFVVTDPTMPGMVHMSVAESILRAAAASTNQKLRIGGTANQGLSKLRSFIAHEIGHPIDSALYSQQDLINATIAMRGKFPRSYVDSIIGYGAAYEAASVYDPKLAIEPKAFKTSARLVPKPEGGEMTVTLESVDTSKLGPVMREAVTKFLKAVKVADPSNPALDLRYPFDNLFENLHYGRDPRAIPEASSELFAQLVSLYNTRPEAMKRELPVGYKYIERKLREYGNHQSGLQQQRDERDGNVSSQVRTRSSVLRDVPSRAAGSRENDNALGRKGRTEPALESGVRERSVPEERASYEGINPLPVDEQEGKARLERRLKRKPGVGDPQTPRTKLVAKGRTETVGKISLRDWVKRVETHMSVGELQTARQWYKQMHDLLTPIYGEDAPKMAMAWLLSQKRASPSKGMLDVLRASDLAAGKKKIKGAGLNENTIKDVLMGILPENGVGAKLYDFVDSELGKKTRTVMNDDRRGRQPAAIDVWALRDVGFVDDTLRAWVAKEFGEKQAAKLSADATDANPTETRYEYGIDFYNDLVDHLNATNYDGGGWTAREVQAVGWVNMQKVMGVEAEFVGDIVEKNTRRVSVGLAPGEGSPRGTQSSKQMSVKEAVKAIAEMAQVANVSILDSEAGVGGYMGGLEGSIQVDAFASPESVQDLMDMIGYAFQQTEMMSTRTLKSGKNTAIDVHSPDLKTSAQANAFFKAFMNQPGVKDTKTRSVVPWMKAPGFQQTKGKTGIRLVNFGGHWSQKEIAQIGDWLDAAARQAGIEIQTEDHHVELNTTGNDWTKDQAGGAYLASLMDRGRLQEVQWLRDRYGVQTGEGNSGKGNSGQVTRKRSDSDRVRPPGYRPEVRGTVPQEIKKKIDDAIRYTKVNGQMTDLRHNRVGTTLTARDESKRDLFLRKMQDKYLRLKRWEEAVAKERGWDRLPDWMSAYRAEERMHGKTREDLDKIERNTIEPLTKVLHKHDIELEELGLYMYARHAAERNAQIAKINKAMPDGGSGMFNADAKTILDFVSSQGMTSKFEEAAKYVDDMLEENRQRLEDFDLEDDFIVGTWRANYDHYVPLKGFAEDEDVTSTESGLRLGKGLSIGGREGLRALGRSLRAYNPVVNAVRDSTEKVIRARKNEVGKRFLNFVRANPNKDLWEILDYKSVERFYNKSTKEVEFRQKNPIGSKLRGENLFEVKKGGRTFYIDLKDPVLRDAMLNMGEEKIDNGMRFVLNTFGRVSRFLAAVNTRWNPVWTLINAPRDFTAGMLNIMAEEDLNDGLIRGEDIAGKVALDIASTKPHRAFWRHIHGKTGTDPEAQAYDRMAAEFMEDGGATGWVRTHTMEEERKRIENLIKAEASGFHKALPVKALKGFLAGIEHINDTIENATRLAAYKNARDAGVSRDKAASLAKNMTINFNRKGEISTVANSLYMFFNAAVQGDAQFFRTMSSKKARRAMMAIAGVHASIAVYNMMAMDEDDEDYAAIPEYLKTRSMPLYIGGRLIVFPLPYGYSAISYAATKAAEVAAGKAEAGDAALSVTGKFLDDVIPLHLPEGEGMALRAITPTAGQPFVDLAYNQNYFGNKIYRQQIGNVPDPDSSMSMRTTNPGWVAMAQLMNKATGGSEKISGFVDVSPDSLRYIAEYATGGAGRTVFGAVDWTRDPDFSHAPFVSKLVSSLDTRSASRLYYDRMSDLLQTQAQWKYLKGPEKVAFAKENFNELLAARQVNETEKRLRKLRQLRSKIEDSQLDDDRKEERIKILEDQMGVAYDTFFAQYRKIMDN